MTEYHVGKFVIVEPADGNEEETPSVPALVIGVDLKVTVITPGKVVRTFTTKDFDPEFLNEDGTAKDLGDEAVTDVARKAIDKYRLDGHKVSFMTVDEGV